MLNREKVFALALVVLGALGLVWSLANWSRLERWGEPITREAPSPSPAAVVAFFRPTPEEVDKLQIETLFFPAAGGRREAVKPVEVPQPIILDWPPLPPTESGPPPPTALVP